MSSHALIALICSSIMLICLLVRLQYLVSLAEGSEGTKAERFKKLEQALESMRNVIKATPGKAARWL